MEDFEITGGKFKENVSTKKHAMIQYFGLTPTKQPIILSRVYEGEKEIDKEHVKKLIQDKESSLILLNNQNKTNQLEYIDEILQEEYGYIPITIDFNFNFQ